MGIRSGEEVGGGDWCYSLGQDELDADETIVQDTSGYGVAVAWTSENCENVASILKTRILLGTTIA